MEHERSNQPRHEGELEDRAKNVFDRSVEQLEPRARSRLAQARASALAKRRSTRAVLPRWLWLPASAVAAAAAVWLVWHGQVVPETPLQAMVLGDLEILLGEEDLELYEDLEFYGWLEAQSELLREDSADDGVG